MSTINEKRRLIIKRTNTPGVVPTVPTIDDINTFIATDIFKGELFYNIADNILYTRDNSGIVTVGGGGFTPVYYTEDTTVGIELASVLVDDGTGNFSDMTVRPGIARLYSESGLDVSEVGVDPSGFTAIYTNGVSLNSIVLGNISGSVIKSFNGFGSDSTLTLNNANGQWNCTNGTQTNFITNDASNGIDLYSSSGTNTTTIQVRPSFVNFSGVGYYLKTTTTSNNTPTTIQTINTTAGKVYNISVKVTGLSTTNGYGAEMFGTFKNIGGTLTQISTTDLTQKSDFTTATTQFSISGTDILIQVVGETSTGINWRIQTELLS